ncbi:MAG: cytochrome P450 [Microscillaceae bacterium]|nr:cytochrome P450 [Microscillaceae bacterium]
MKAPILGDTLGFLRRPVALFEEKRRQYGDVFKVRLFGQTVVFLIGTEANKFLLIEQAKYLSSHKGWENIDELFHDGLMLKDGTNHQHHRSIMQSAFRKESLKGYMALMMPKIEAF